MLDQSTVTPLQNPGFCKNFNIDLDGYESVWSDEIDLSEYELWRNGVSLEDKQNIDRQCG